MRHPLARAQQKDITDAGMAEMSERYREEGGEISVPPRGAADAPV